MAKIELKNLVDFIDLHRPSLVKVHCPTTLEVNSEYYLTAAGDDGGRFLCLSKLATVASSGGSVIVRHFTNQPTEFAKHPELGASSFKDVYGFTAAGGRFDTIDPGRLARDCEIALASDDLGEPEENVRYREARFIGEDAEP